MSQRQDDDEILAAARAGFLEEADELLAQFEQCLLFKMGEILTRLRRADVGKVLHVVKNDVFGALAPDLVKGIAASHQARHAHHVRCL